MPQGSGRFDVPASPRGVVYFAETPEHAVAEMIQQFRNHPEPVTTEDLTRWGQRLALVRATLDRTMWQKMADLCNPDTLTSLGLTAELAAYRDRRRTQTIAVDLYDKRYAGLRWWSAFWGEWHSVILFQERLRTGAVTYGEPIALDAGSAVVREAAALLDIG